MIGQGLTLARPGEAAESIAAVAQRLDATVSLLGSTVLVHACMTILVGHEDTNLGMF